MSHQRPSPAPRDPPQKERAPPFLHVKRRGSKNESLKQFFICNFSLIFWFLSHFLRETNAGVKAGAHKCCIKDVNRILAIESSVVFNPFGIFLLGGGGVSGDATSLGGEETAWIWRCCPGRDALVASGTKGAGNPITLMRGSLCLFGNKDGVLEMTGNHGVVFYDYY